MQFLRPPVTSSFNIFSSDPLLKTLKYILAVLWHPNFYSHTTQQVKLQFKLQVCNFILHTQFRFTILQIAVQLPSIAIYIPVVLFYATNTGLKIN